MKPLSEQTLYEILEVAENAPSGEIERAYQRARALYGADSLATYTLMAPEEVALLGRRIEEAHNVLLDPVARAGYDARLASGTPVPQAGRMSDSTPTVTATVPPGFQRIPTEPEPEMARAGPAEAAEARVPPAEAGAGPEASEPIPPMPPVAPVMVPAASPVRLRIEAAARPAARPPTPVEAAATPAPVPLQLQRAPEPPGPVPARVLEKSVVIPEGARWTGELLRRAREARGLTVRQLAERTKITRHHIENIEADRFDRLPAPVYLRGMVMSVARELRLDGLKVARSYLEHVAAHPPGAK